MPPSGKLYRIFSLQTALRPCTACIQFMMSMMATRKSISLELLIPLSYR